jgi:hypothetical protein
MLISVLAIGCGGSTPTGPSAPTLTAPAATYEGTWTGQTDQAQKLTFSVVGNRITSLDFNFVYSASEPLCSGAGGFGGGGVFATISDNAFSVVNPFVGGSQQFTWALTGIFTSLTSATGTLEVTFSSVAVGPGSPCSASVKTTWSAQSGR